MARPRIAVVVSHPIQHFCPQYAALAEVPDWELRVFFASAAGARPYEDPQFGRTVVWDGLHLGRFAHEFLNGGAALPISTAIDAPDLGTRLALYDPDVVLVYGYAQRLQRRALGWAKALGKRVLMVADSELRRSRYAALRLAKRIALPRYFRRVDAFLTSGDANEAYYRHYGVPAERLFRSPCPVDREAAAPVLSAPAAHRAAIRERLGLPPDALVVSTVGKLLASKRQEDVVAMLDHVGPDVHVVVVGAGPDEARLWTQAARSRHAARIRFTGFVQPAELPALYAATDVYVQASEADAHSLAVSEAVYLGCPVVLSDRCGSWGPTDDVQPGRNGLVYSCGDVRALAGAVRTLADAPALRERFGAASRAIGEQAQRQVYGEGLRAALARLGAL